MLARVADAWHDVPEVTTSLLRFVHELVYNKGPRVVFEQSSPNGILLFREASRVIVAYGTRALPAAGAAPSSGGGGAVDETMDALGGGGRGRPRRGRRRRRRRRRGRGGAGGGGTDEMWRRKYKGIALALGVTCALSGNYVNFGVFALYETARSTTRSTSACGSR